MNCEAMSRSAQQLTLRGPSNKFQDIVNRAICKICFIDNGLDHFCLICVQFMILQREINWHEKGVRMKKPAKPVAMRVAACFIAQIKGR